MDFLKGFVKEKKNFLIVACIVFIGFLLRILGYNWGKTSTFQPDESLFLAGVFDLIEKPSYFIYDRWIYPTQVSTKLVGWAIIVFQKLTGITLSTVKCYFVYRIYNCFIGAGTIIVAYFLGKKMMSDSRFGYLVALVVSIFPPYIRMAKQVTGDIPVLFFTMLSILASLYYLETKEKRYLILMSVFGAFATMEKWHGAVIICYIALCAIVLYKKNIKQILIEAVIAAPTFALTMIAIAPNILLNISDVIEQMTYAKDYNGGGSIQPITDYIFGFLNYSGLFCLVFCIIGLVYLIKTRRLSYMPVVAGMINWIALWLLMNRTQERWAMGIYFFQVLLLASGNYASFKFIKSREWDAEQIAKKKLLECISVVCCVLVFASYFSYACYITLNSCSSDQDVRIVGESVLADLGGNLDNTISEMYTSYCPGCARDGGIATNLDIYSVGCDEEGPYVTVEGAKYICLSGRADDPYINDLLDENATLVFEADINVGDLFWEEWGKGKWYLPEIYTLVKNFKEIGKLTSGGYIGAYDGLKIYDISSFRYVEDAE